MPKSCLICSNKFEKGSAISFHRFPKNIEHKKNWCKVLGINENLPFYEVLCSDHFSPESFRTSPAGKKSLVDGTLPIAVSVLQPMSIGSISSDEISPNHSIAWELEKKYIPLKCGLQKQTKRGQIIPIPFEQLKMVTPNDFPASSTLMASDCSETEREYRRLNTRNKPLSNILQLKKEVDSSEVYKRKWKTAQKCLMNQRVIISNQKRQISYLKSKLASYRKVMIQLKKNNFLSTSVEAIIDVEVPQGSKAIVIERIVGGPFRQKYPPELIEHLL